LCQNKFGGFDLGFDRLNIDAVQLLAVPRARALFRDVIDQNEAPRKSIC